MRVRADLDSRELTVKALSVFTMNSELLTVDRGLWTVNGSLEIWMMKRIQA
jgi:hypothetical protein